ncbi:MAG: DMT family transporter [Actinobacteria bacterium]|nr:DMT family transporter [Actinomycetota bacterium]
MTTPLAVVLAAVGGALIATQGALLGPFSDRVRNVMVVALWVHVAGAVFAGAVVLFGRYELGITELRSAPWLLLAGVAGVGIVASIGAVVGYLGLGTTLAVLTGVQLLIALLLDASGILERTVELSLQRVLGAGLIVVGVLLVFGRGEG